MPFAAWKLAAAWKLEQDEKYAGFEVKLMRAQAIRSRRAAAQRAGRQDTEAFLFNQLTALTLEVHLRLMLQAYGFPEGMAAEEGTRIDSLKLQVGGNFDSYASGLLNAVDVIDQTDLVDYRLKAYGWPASTDWLWWPWSICGGFLSLILHYYGLTPYWAVASWLLSSGVLWSAAIAWGFGRWYAAITIPALFGWMYVYYKDVVMKAMCDDIVRLRKGLDKLLSDEPLYPEQLQKVLQARHDRGSAVLDELKAAQRAANRILNLRSIVPDRTAGVGGAAAAPPPPPGHQGGHQGGHQLGAGNSGGGSGRGGAAAGSGSGGVRGVMGRAAAGGGSVGRNSVVVDIASVDGRAAAMPATFQPAHVVAEQSQAIRGAGPSSGAATFPTTAAPPSGSAGGIPQTGPGGSSGGGGGGMRRAAAGGGGVGRD